MYRVYGSEAGVVLSSSDWAGGVPESFKAQGDIRRWNSGRFGGRSTGMKAQPDSKRLEESFEAIKNLNLQHCY